LLNFVGSAHSDIFPGRVRISAERTFAPVKWVNG
jgi:hypothetical protein